MGEWEHSADKIPETVLFLLHKLLVPKKPKQPAALHSCPCALHSCPGPAPHMDTQGTWQPPWIHSHTKCAILLHQFKLPLPRPLFPFFAWWKRPVCSGKLGHFDLSDTLIFQVMRCTMKAVISWFVCTNTSKTDFVFDLQIGSLLISPIPQ